MCNESVDFDQEPYDNSKRCRHDFAVVVEWTWTVDLTNVATVQMCFFIRRKVNIPRDLFSALTKYDKS